MKLLAIVGTNAPRSYNRSLLLYMKRHFSAQAEIEIQEISDLPLFQEEAPVPAAVHALNDKIVAADGVIFGVPEYDHAISASLKSAIEWLSSAFKPFEHKPVMIVGTSLGIQGTSRAQDDLRKILNAPGIDAYVLPGDEFMMSYAGKAFDAYGNLTDAKTISFLEQCFGDFTRLIHALAGQGTPAVKWTEDYDVVVLGFGGAGATAARFAADAGAKVLIVEAAPYGHEGGNTRYAAQHVVTGENLDQLTQYYQQLNAPFVTPPKTLHAYLSGMQQIPQYFKQYLGINAVSWKHDIKPGDAVAVKAHMAEYPELKGSDTVDFALVHKRDKDAALWKALRQQVLDRRDHIDIWLDSRAQHLIQEPGTRIIRGVQVLRKGKLVNVHANRGVVLAVGGFENNPELTGTFLHAEKLTPIGTLYNRGDGVKMAQEVGAKLWHMTNYESHGIMAGVTFAEEPNHRGRQINGWSQLNHGSIFVVGDDGTRYFPEDAKHRHGHINIHGHWQIPMHQEHPYLVFDAAQYAEFQQQTQTEGQLPYPPFLEKLVKRDNLADLAAAIGVPSAQLTQTVSDFNTAAASGRDVALGRDPKTMRAFGDGPFYAIALAGDVLNTQGGPQRDEHAQILAVDGQPIPHLYGAGELGGIVANCYQGGGNLAECLIFGKLAGESAAAAKPDADYVDVTTKSVNDIVDQESLSQIPVGPHQYLGSSDAGLGGKLVTRVTYDNGKIQNVEVVEQHETAGIGQRAIQQLPQEIVAHNSLEVDAVTGASASSRAIKEAVQSALNQADQTTKHAS